MLVLCIQGDMQEEVFHTMTDFEAFLEKKGFSPNDEQRRVIYADKATVVSAGAGSGKTTVLAYRFLRLVMEGKAHVDEILTLTFTNKASPRLFIRSLNYSRTRRYRRSIRSRHALHVLHRSIIRSSRISTSSLKRRWRRWERVCFRP